MKENEAEERTMREVDIKVAGETDYIVSSSPYSTMKVTTE